MIKKLAACIGEYKKSTLLAPIFIAFEVILEVIIPLLMAKLIDDGINSGNIKNILVIGGILVVVCGISLLCGALSGRYAAIASSGFAKNMRREMYYRVQNFSFTNIDKFSTASIVTRLTTDVTNVQNAFQMIIRIAVRAPAMLLFSLIMAFTINGKLPFAFLAAVPILAIGLFLIISNAHPIFERVFKTYDKLNNVVQENLRAIRVVKAFVREDHEADKFKTVSNNIYKDFTKAEKLIAFNGPLMQFCMYGCMLAIAWFGAKMIVGGTLTTGELMSMITYIMQILMSLMMLSMIFVMITISRASAERIVEVLSEESDIVNGENPVMTVANGDISFKDVVFRYSKNAEKNCLEHISIDIKSGQTVGIIGGTGSSKSTFVQLIPRLYDVSEGCVEVGDVDVRNYDIHALRNEVAMVLQKNELFSGTIKENLRWGNENADDDELIRVCRLAQADDFINAFPDKYDTYIEQGGTNVSGGQKQRLCIARALLKKPKILILDDSTSAVDTHTDSLIRKAMREEIPETTKIIIAQRISSVQDADMIIVLDDGKIADCGNHDKLMKTSEIYREVYNSQMKEDEADGR